MLQLGLNNISNEGYHADNTRLSSSNLKLLLKDPAQFYEEKILGNKPKRERNRSFDEGTYVHSCLLEPETVEKDFAFYTGWTRRESYYKHFAEENQGKIILTMPERSRCDKLVAACKKNPKAMELLSSGVSEQTVCADLFEVPVKIRTDKIDWDKGIIIDIKTSSYPIDRDSFEMTVERWSYELSAALYLKVAEEFWQRRFDFYFIALGKQDSDCEVYRLSDKTRFKGDMQVTKALNLYKQCKETGIWEAPKVVKSKTEHEILEV